MPVTYGLSSIHICSFEQPQISLYKLSKGSTDLTSRKDIKLSEVPCLRGTVRTHGAEVHCGFDGIKL